MKLKLDLHPFYNDSAKIESALSGIITEALNARASEVEIIPGKGSGVLKKTVLRFLDRPEIRGRYHRVEKDSENWGRLFVRFRHERHDPPTRIVSSVVRVSVACACCGDPIETAEPEEDREQRRETCPWCGSPNRLTLQRDRRARIHVHAVLDYSN